MAQVPIIETGTHVRWDSWREEMYTDMEDHWVARVHGFDPNSQYKWDSEFLNAVEKEGVKYYEILDIREGDILRMPNGSTKEYYRVTQKSRDDIEVENLTVHEVYEEFDVDQDHPEVKGTGIQDVDIRISGDEEDVEYVKGLIARKLIEENVWVSWADEHYDIEGRPGEQVYGDIDLSDVD